MSLIPVYHFSPFEGLSTLIPHVPSHQEYSDIKGVYLTLSLEMCKCWARALKSEGYWKPPFYIYTGFVEATKLHKIIALEARCEAWGLELITNNDIKQEIDQVVTTESIAVKQIEVYTP